MITTLREAKAKLSWLVRLAARGEDVIITVRGKPRARLSGIPAHAPDAAGAWVDELRDLQRTYTGTQAPGDSQEILDDLRSERV